MKRRDTLFVVLILSIVIIASISACSEPVAPAIFDVTSLTVKPNEVTIGDTSNVTAKISNSGGGVGIYNAVLTVDGSKVNTKALTIAPGATETVTFSLSKSKAGTYKITVGNRVANLTVNPKLSSQPIGIKYDDGLANDYLTVDKPSTGYLVSFDPPSNPFTINSVSVFGFIYGGHGFMINDIDLQIWDKDKEPVYSTKIDKDEFPLLSYIPSNLEKQGAWANVPIPDIEVNGSFYIHIYTGITTGQGFRMGTDDQLNSIHSDITVRSNEGKDDISPKWNYPIARWYGDKSRVNWMVRVSGLGWITEE
ncbi:MAG: hypothetical protein JXA01_08215 [Dehalococcoidia bacterium]|nr:hypothetical protein [Dehalococcoidia bacterium]